MQQMKIQIRAAVSVEVRDELIRVWAEVGSELHFSTLIEELLAYALVTRHSFVELGAVNPTICRLCTAPPDSIVHLTESEQEEERALDRLLGFHHAEAVQ